MKSMGGVDHLHPPFCQSARQPAQKGAHRRMTVDHLNFTRFDQFRQHFQRPGVFSQPPGGSADGKRMGDDPVFFKIVFPDGKIRRVEIGSVMDFRSHLLKNPDIVLLKLPQKLADRRHNQNSETHDSSSLKQPRTPGLLSVPVCYSPKCITFFSRFPYELNGKEGCF